MSEKITPLLLDIDIPPPKCSFTKQLLMVTIICIERHTNVLVKLNNTQTCPFVSKNVSCQSETENEPWTPWEKKTLLLQYY